MTIYFDWRLVEHREKVKMSVSIPRDAKTSSDLETKHKKPLEESH